MRKIHILCAALFAVFAFSALFASMAGAAEWLVEELSITELLSTETIGELTFKFTEEPIIGNVEFLCSRILDGTISPSGLDEVTELLTLTGTAISLVALTEPGLLCINIVGCPTPLVWVEGLPWKTELLSTTDDLTTATEIAYYVDCMGIIGEPSELCSQTTLLATLENMIELPSLPNDVLANISEVNTSNCNNAGAKKGAIISDEPALIQVLEGLELAVS